MDSASFGWRDLDREPETRWNVRVFMPGVEVCQGSQTGLSPHRFHQSQSFIRGKEQ
jgi:hypothetical protein